MSLLTRILGHDQPVLPYDVAITYADGSTGAVHVFAPDMRKALLDANYWLPQHLPARQVVITERTT